MGAGHGGQMSHYGRPMSRPMTPTGGLQLGIMPGMGGQVTSISAFDSWSAIKVALTSPDADM